MQSLCLLRSKQVCDTNKTVPTSPVESWVGGKSLAERLRSLHRSQQLISETVDA